MGYNADGQWVNKPMNPEIKERWVAALRSGEYAQTRGMLHQPDLSVGPVGYCCLGVLCKVAEEDGIVGWRDTVFATLDNGRYEPVASKGFYAPDAKYGDNGMLPEAVREWSGMETEDGTHRLGGYSNTLADLNDTGGHDFNQIADVIEEAF